WRRSRAPRDPKAAAEPPHSITIRAVLSHVATRASLLGFSDIVKIRNRVLAMRARGQRVLQLEGGEPFMHTPDFVKDAMKAAVDANHTRYAPSSGLPTLLDALVAKLARKNMLTVTPEHLIVTAGGAHALFCAFQASVNPGDDVMFFAPYWTPIKDQVSFSGGNPVRVPWDDVRQRGDLRELLESRLTPKTRVIYVNTPANPTGDLLTREQLQAVADFAIAHDLTVIADEAYEDLVYDGEHVSIASLPGMLERTISVYTFSKSFSMTGWRIGYLVAEKPFMEFIRKLVLNSVNGVSTPTQHAALAAVSADPAWFDPLREEYRRRRDLLVGAFNAAGFRCLTPPGAFYTFPDVRERLGDDSWKAMEALLDRTSIASVPGAVFGPEGEGHLRMSFSIAEETLAEAVEALRGL
ncbi:MAG TPA: aminotransferase class I/II-fold pyridoxal phosphate-dependent enzyme, partial [Thermoanaerobaculia bacterium]|nr:aminotransferase class I/II-fold pyridoxal phosphate-dependent enzyme [Thermoanaerobaculia bacterium]